MLKDLYDSKTSSATTARASSRTNFKTTSKARKMRYISTAKNCLATQRQVLRTHHDEGLESCLCSSANCSRVIAENFDRMRGKMLTGWNGGMDI